MRPYRAYDLDGDEDRGPYFLCPCGHYGYGRWADQGYGYFEGYGRHSDYQFLCPGCDGEVFDSTSPGEIETALGGTKEGSALFPKTDILEYLRTAEKEMAREVLSATYEVVDEIRWNGDDRPTWFPVILKPGDRVGLEFGNFSHIIDVEKMTWKGDVITILAKGETPYFIREEFMKGIKIHLVDMEEWDEYQEKTA